MADMQQAPTAPPAPPAQSRKGAFIIGGAIVLAALVFGMTQAQGSDTPAAPASPTSSTFTDQGTPVEECLDLTAGMPLSDKAIASMEDVVTSIERYDVEGAVLSLGDAADYTRDMAGYMTADPSISGSLYEAADLYDRSAAMLGAGQLGPATTYIQDATAEVSDATSALKTTSVLPC